MAEQKGTPFLTEDEWEEMQHVEKIISNQIETDLLIRTIAATINAMNKVSEPEVVKMQARDLRIYVGYLEKRLIESIELRKTNRN